VNKEKNILFLYIIETGKSFKEAVDEMCA